MSLLATEMRNAYRAQRGVSQGAGITLVSRSGGYRATFDCAARCAQVLGDRCLEDYGQHGQSWPIFKIPLEDTYRALVKLAEHFSIALLDLVTDETGSRFVLVWKIPSKADLLAAADLGKQEVAANDPNQASFNLDEY